MSADSEPFDLNNGSWPLWVILVVAFGAFLIAVLIGVLIFLYYYKRHVKVGYQTGCLFFQSPLIYMALLLEKALL
jgi:uncharacterized integral membrane protein